MNWILLAIVIVVPILMLWYIIGIYNRLVTLKNRFQNGFAQIEVQLKCPLCPPDRSDSFSERNPFDFRRRKFFFGKHILSESTTS